jgi:hypothetical protein
MRDKLVPMVQHAFKTHGPIGGKAAFAGMPFFQRGKGVVSPKAEYEQFQMLEDYRARMKAQQAPQPQIENPPLPPLDPAPPPAAAPAPAPAAAPAPSIADAVVPKRGKSTFSSFGAGGNSSTRRVGQKTKPPGGAFGGGMF